MRSHRLLAAVAATAAACLLATGCSGDSGSSGATGGTKTIEFWHAYNETGPETKALNEVVIPAFQKDHPDIKVKAVALPYDDLRQKLLTSAAGGTLPCLVRSDIIWVPELAKLGVLAPMDEQLADFQAVTKNVYPGPLETNKYNGKYYGVPLDTNTRVLMYNAQTLASVGVQNPPATFDDLRALAGKLKAAGKKMAFADNGTSGWNLLPWIWSAGGDMLSPDGTKATGYLNSAASVAGVQLLVDLFNEKQVPAIITGSQGGVETSQGLAQGSYATILDGPWMYPIFQQQFPNFKLQTAKVPAGPGGSISVVGGEDLVMTASCKEKQAAATFTEYMLSDEAQLAMAKVGQMPVLSTLGSQLTSVQAYYGIFAEQLQNARPRPPQPQYTKLEDILSTEVQKAFKGKQTVQAALDAAARQIDAIVAAG
jgi:multiple sugar transport system substrate-binding protein